MKVTILVDENKGKAIVDDKVYENIDIEVSVDEIFEQRLGTYPFSVACSCCGENFSCSSDKNIKNLANFWIKSSGMSISEFYNAALVFE